MTKDYGQVSRTALVRANEISEIAIFWGLVTTVFVIGAAMIKAMPA